MPPLPPTSAIRLISSSSSTKSTKALISKLHLTCHIKPNTSANRQGILSLSPTKIEVCVSAQPREGEANKAVQEVFRRIFKCPKSNISIIRGLKSREKTIAISGIEVKGDEESYLSSVLAKLEDAVVDG